MKKMIHFLMAAALVFVTMNASAQRLKPANAASSKTLNLSLQSQANYKNPGQPAAMAFSGYYMQDFEGPVFPPAGWQTVDLSDSANFWDQSDLGANTGIYSAYINYSAIGTEGDDWLIMPHFSVAASDSLTFWLGTLFSPYPPDSTFILISVTDSATGSFTAVLDVLAEGLNYPAAPNFAYFTYSLSAYTGQDIYVAFRNKNSYGDGVFIDDVTIGTKPAVNAKPISLNLAPFVPIITPVIPVATVKNDGLSTQTFPVTLEIGSYSSVKTVTALSAGASVQVNFDPWSPPLGSMQAILYTQLSGDGFPYDDTLTKTILGMEPFPNSGWRSKSITIAPMFDAATATINDPLGSYIYLFGGAGTSMILDDVERYDPVLNSWMYVSPMPAATNCHSAHNINGMMYMFGGYNPPFSALDNTMIYDPFTDLWSSGTPVPVPVGDYAFGAYNDSLLYVIGGYDGSGDQDLVQIYNTATDTWSNGTNIPVAAAAWRGGICDDKIVVSGGYSQTAMSLLASTFVGTIDPADPTNITWVQVMDYPSGGVARAGAGASIDTVNRLVIFTGGDPNGSGVETLPYTFAYDIISDSWKLGPNKPVPLNNLTNMSCIMYNDSLYMATAGGNDDLGFSNSHQWLNLGPYDFPVGISEINTVSDFNVYPAPFRNSVTIDFTLAENSEVEINITGLHGQQIEKITKGKLNAGVHHLRWNADNYSAGIYFCTLTVNGNKVVKKLVKSE